MSAVSVHRYPTRDSTRTLEVPETLVSPCWFGSGEPPSESPCLHFQVLPPSVICHTSPCDRDHNRYRPATKIFGLPPGRLTPTGRRLGWQDISLKQTRGC